MQSIASTQPRRGKKLRRTTYAARGLSQEQRIKQSKNKDPLLNPSESTQGRNTHCSLFHRLIS
jgi:hypothetical protein